MTQFQIHMQYVLLMFIDFGEESSLMGTILEYAYTIQLKFENVYTHWLSTVDLHTQQMSEKLAITLR